MEVEYEQRGVVQRKDSNQSLTWKHFLIFGVVTALITFSLMGLKRTTGYLPWYVHEVPVIMGFYILLFLYKPVRHFVFSSFVIAPLKRPMTYVYMFLGLVIQFLMTALLFHWDILWQLGEFTSHLSSHPFVPVWEAILFLIVGCILVPLYEEAIFRGFLYQFGAHKFPWWTALVVVSLFFGAFHPDVLAAAIAGAVLTLLYKKTGSLFPGMICHGLWNLFAIIAGHGLSMWQFFGGSVY